MAQLLLCGSHPAVSFWELVQDGLVPVRKRFAVERDDLVLFVEELDVLDLPFRLSGLSPYFCQLKRYFKVS